MATHFVNPSSAALIKSAMIARKNLKNISK